MDIRIVKAAEAFAMYRLNADKPSYVKYHSAEHTSNVASEVRELGKAEGFDENRIRCLEVAAWFHDLGYLENAIGHEEISAKLADDFLSENGVQEDERNFIHRLILATEMSHIPRDKPEEVIRDADLAHLGMKNARERGEQLRQEKETLTGHPISKSDWLKMNIEFFEDHQYYTKSAKERFGAAKEKEMKALKAKLEKKAKPHKSDEKAKSKGRGVETMFRVTLKNHTALSQIADNKANIMLSVNAIIISVVLSSLLPKLDNNVYLLWPTLLLLTVCILAVIFATISTIPKVTRGGATPEMVKNRQTNLLFFGNFQGLNLDVYIAGMKDMMDDDDYLYETLIKDLYYLGKVLNKKYYYLRLCYAVFVVGIVLSVIAYMFSLYLMFQPPA